MSNGHDNKGRFTKNNQEWRKRQRNGLCDLSDLRAIIDANVSASAVATAWKRIDRILETGGPGWRVFFELYLDRRYGKPAQFVEADVTSAGESIAPVFREVVVHRESVDDQRAG